MNLKEIIRRIIKEETEISEVAYKFKCKLLLSDYGQDLYDNNFNKFERCLEAYANEIENFANHGVHAIYLDVTKYNPFVIEGQCEALSDLSDDNIIDKLSDAIMYWDEKVGSDLFYEVSNFTLTKTINENTTASAGGEYLTPKAFGKVNLKPLVQNKLWSLWKGKSDFYSKEK